MDGKRLEKQIKMYQELAQKDGSVDVAGLVMNALDTKESNDLPLNLRRLAYFVSVAAPPFGLAFAAKFWFSGKDDGPEAALTCAALTAVSILLLAVTMSLSFSGSGLDASQVQQLDPEEIRSLIQ